MAAESLATVRGVTSRRGGPDVDGDRARKRANREMVAAYHERELRSLLEHVREGFGRLDSGQIDVFEMDELIHHYGRSAKELWKFCGYGGSRVDWAVHSIEYSRSSGSEPDWWERGRPRGRHAE